MSGVFALISGLIFGLGLIVGGMADPSKVLGFLDVAGLWDPSLAFVMAGAIGVGLVAFSIAKGKDTTWLGLPMQIPTGRQLDRRLIWGSIAFGVGWGLAGFCPGPAIVALGAGEAKAFVFVAAMLAGMLIYEWINSRATKNI